MSFAVSLLLLAWVSLRWARHLCDTPADRYWIFVGTALLQVGAITGLSSLAHQLTPAGWLVMQVLMAAAPVPLTGGWRRSGLAGALPGGPGLRAALVTRFTGLTAWGLLLLCAILGVLLLALVRQALEPIYHFDDRMYHASRVLYLIQHATVFPFETHNIRQNLVLPAPPDGAPPPPAAASPVELDAPPPAPGPPLVDSTRTPGSQPQRGREWRS